MYEYKQTSGRNKQIVSEEELAKDQKWFDEYFQEEPGEGIIELLRKDDERIKKRRAFLIILVTIGLFCFGLIKLNIYSGFQPGLLWEVNEKLMVLIFFVTVAFNCCTSLSSMQVIK